MRRMWMAFTMLLTLTVLLVAAGRGGQGLWQVSAVGWLLLALVAGGQWLRTRQPALGLFALGMVAIALSSLFRLARFGLPSVLLNPLYPLGLALAAASWAQRSLPRLSQVLVGSAAAVAALSWLYDFTFNWHGGSIRVAAAMNFVVGLGWALGAVVAWRGYWNSRLQPLLWLGAHDAAAALGFILTSASMMGARLPNNTFLLVYPVVFSLPLVMAVGVVWTVDA